MLKAVIFDMDGVLIDSMPYHVQAMKCVFDEMGLDMDEKDIYEREGEKTLNVVDLLLAKAQLDTSGYDRSEIIEKYISEFRRNASIRVFGGMDECLKSLKGHFMLAVVSGSDRIVVHDIMQNHFPGIFDVIVTGDDTEQGKPAPDPYLKALGMLSKGKDECLVVENAPMGLFSAKSAGLFCIAIPTYVDPEELCGADLLVQDHEELVRVLMQLDPSVSLTDIKI